MRPKRGVNRRNWRANRPKGWGKWGETGPHLAIGGRRSNAAIPASLAGIGEWASAGTSASCGYGRKSGRRRRAPAITESSCGGADNIQTALKLCRTKAIRRNVFLSFAFLPSSPKNRPLGLQ